jgi:hypothetical protein
LTFTSPNSTANSRDGHHAIVEEEAATGFVAARETSLLASLRHATDLATAMQKIQSVAVSQPFVNK